MRKRSIRHRGLRRAREVMDLDITSLLDILVIMLVFLLKSYNSSGVVLNVPKGIELPKSESRDVSSSGVIIQVSKDKIWVDDIELMDVGVISRNRVGAIHQLYNELVKKKKTFIQVEKSSPNAKKFSGNINLIVDKTHRYNLIRRILATAAEAGYKQYKFVVLGE